MSNQAYELLKLKDIFDAGARQLSVPDYQRGYSWEEEQRKDLIDDIAQIITQTKPHRHFTGTVVASRNDDSSVFDLVDGQQRITSLVIFMSCLLRVARAKDMGVLNGQSLSEIEAIYVRSGIETGNTCYQLQLGANRDPLFHEVLREGQLINQKIKNKADQNIVDGATQFYNYLNEQEGINLESIFQAVTETLGFLLYMPKTTAEIGIMFEVINNRGKPLSELEKIKKYFIYFSGRHGNPDLNKKVNDNWPILLESLNTADYTSNDDENRFLRVCWLVFNDYNKAKSYHVYDNLKRVYPPDEVNHLEELSKFIEFITNTAKTYAYLFNSESSDLSDKEKMYLQRIALHPANASILPLIVALFSKERNADKRADILDLLEKLNFRYYITGVAKRNDSGQGDLFEIAFNYYHREFYVDENQNDLSEFDLLREKLIKFIEENASDYDFVKHLTLDKDEAADYYNWQGLKYFLASYEDMLLAKGGRGSRLSSLVAAQDKNKKNDFYQKEHIWAVKERSVVQDEFDRDVNKRRLGNFILLSAEINRDVGKERPEIKVEKYFQHTTLQPDTLMIRVLKQDFESAKQVIDESNLYKRQVKMYWYYVYQTFFDIRERRLVNFAIKRWQVEGIKRPVERVLIDSKLDKNVFKCLPEYNEKVKSVASEVHSSESELIG